MIEYHVYEFEELLGGVCFYPRGGFHRRGYISWGGGLIEYLYGDRCGFFFRRSVTAGSVEAAIFIISMGDHREIYGSWVFGAEAIQHVSSTSWRIKARRASWAKMSPYVFGVYTVLILWGFRNQFNCSVLCDSPLGFNVKIKWESKKLKIRCFLCIWRLATYVIILYKPYSLSGYCDNWISQSKNISENILRDYSDFDLFVIHNRFVSKKIHSFESLRSVSPAQAYAAFCRFWYFLHGLRVGE